MNILTKVVMLPTTKANDQMITKSMTTGKLFFNRTASMAEKHRDLEGATMIHLYFTNNQPIKEGDWVLKSNNGVFKVEKDFLGELVIRLDDDVMPIEFLRKLRKIIASTDHSLGISKPGAKFLKSYCDAHEEFDEVDVEYEMVFKAISDKAKKLLYPHENELWRKDSEGLVPDSIFLRSVEDSSIVNYSSNGFVIGEDIEGVSIPKHHNFSNGSKTNIIIYKAKKPKEPLEFTRSDVKHLIREAIRDLSTFGDDKMDKWISTKTKKRNV